MSSSSCASEFTSEESVSGRAFDLVTSETSADRLRNLGGIVFCIVEMFLYGRKNVWRGFREIEVVEVAVTVLF